MQPIRKLYTLATRTLPPYVSIQFQLKNDKPLSDPEAFASAVNMPNTSGSHSVNRTKVCVVCWQKCSSMRPVAASGLSRIQKYYDPHYDPNNECYPTSLCSRCNKLLYDIDSGTKTTQCLPPAFDISRVTITPSTRGIPLCYCLLCQTARFNPVGVPDIPNKLHPHPLGRPSSSSHDPLCPAETITICQRCHSAVGRGLHHNCTLSQRRENLSAEFLADPRGSEIHASDVLKNKMQTSQDTIKLATRGSDLTLSRPGPSSTSHGIFANKAIPIHEMRRLQTTAGLSLEQTKKTAHILREWKGRQCISPNLMPELQTLDNMLSDLYAVQVMQFDIAGGHKEPRHLVFCTDIRALLEILSNTRGYQSTSVLAKVGIDKGGSFLKICLTLIVADGHSSSHFAEGGIKKLVLLAVVEDVIETYDNMKIMLEQLHLERIEFVICADMKMANVLLGLQSASSTYPCPWCELNRDEFASPRRELSLRNLGSIRTLAHKYQEATLRLPGQKHLTAARFKNCVHVPLFKLSDDTTVLHIIPPMELHLMLGIVKCLVDELENRLTNIPGCQLRVDDWIRSAGVQRTAYHGGQFNGNNCSKLLESIDFLDRLIQENGAFAAVPVAHALRCFRDVKANCFGEEVRTNYFHTLRRFEQAYTDLGISVTPKVHAVFDHIAPFLQNQPSMSSSSNVPGLGKWSEQASEAVHHDFESFWEQGRRIAMTHCEYSQRLKNCVVSYSSRHI